VALRIRPLSEAGSAPTGGGLRIRPLSDFVAPSAAPPSANLPASITDPYYGQAPGRDPSYLNPDLGVFAGTRYAAGGSNPHHRYFWEDYGEGTRRQIGPNTNVYNEATGEWQEHPILKFGTPEYDVFLQAWQAGRHRGPFALGSVGDGTGGIAPTQSMTNAEIAAQFGHLAGQNPLMAALTSVTAPTDTSTPAGILGGIFGAVAPAPFGTLTSMVAHAMQQQAINDAANQGFTGITHNESGVGAPNFGSGMSMSFGLGGDGSGISGGDGGAFHQGGPVTEGPPAGPERHATLLEDEFVVNPKAAKKHRPLLEAINSGAPKAKLRKLLESA
jgi:hypothetical protein